MRSLRGMWRGRSTQSSRVLASPLGSRQVKCNPIALNTPGGGQGVAQREQARDVCVMKPQPTVTGRDSDLRDLLASRGLRVTTQRVALLRALAKVKAPISHPELTERMSESGLDRATV